MILYISSGNKGKIEEFLVGAEQLNVVDLTIEALPGLEAIHPPEENGTTFEENATTKALYYSQFTSGYVVADDSGLEVDALGNGPGVRSARYAGPQASDSQNNQLLLENLRESRSRSAHFVCVLAVARQGNLLFTAHGRVDGEILAQGRGSRGFGYDPLFFYPPLAKSFGELSSSEKLAVSHRGNAIRELSRWAAGRTTA